MQSYKKMLTDIFNVSGRTIRRDYWIAYFIHILVIGLMGGILEIVGTFPAIIYSVFETIIVLYTLMAVIAAFTMKIRRLHDIGKSGWWVLWCTLLTPLLFSGLIIYIIFMCGESEADNQWGPNPNKMETF